MARSHYSVPGISCAHCKRAIESALGDLEGVETVEVSVEGKTVDVVYAEDKVSPDTLEFRLAEEGYPVAK